MTPRAGPMSLALRWSHRAGARHVSKSAPVTTSCPARHGQIADCRARVRGRRGPATTLTSEWAMTWEGCDYEPGPRAAGRDFPPTPCGPDPGGVVLDPGGRGGRSVGRRARGVVADRPRLDRPRRRIADLPQRYSHLGSRGIIPVTILQSYPQGERAWGQTAWPRCGRRPPSSFWDSRHSHRAGPREGGHSRWTDDWGPVSGPSSDPAARPGRGSSRSARG